VGTSGGISVDFFDQLEEMNKPKVERKAWMDEKIMELVTVETLDRVINECINSESGHYAWDVETTGLDSRVFYRDGIASTIDKIVGHCLSPDGIRGYYIPVRHRDPAGDLVEANIPPAVANKALKRLADCDAVAIFHNGKFDHEMLQFAESVCLGEWDDPASYQDTIILAYIRNTRERRKGLKPLSLTELGYEMIELDELFTDEQKKKGGLNFAQLDPTWDAALWYGCSDAICTYQLCMGQPPKEDEHGNVDRNSGFPGLLAQVLNPEPTGQSQATVYKIEKMTLPSTRWMERCRIKIDRDKIKELIRLGQDEWFESLGEVYVEAQKNLGRDVQPGWYRLMAGTANDVGAAADHYRFDPTQMNPDYMTAKKDADKGAKQFRLDPTAPDGKGKERVRTIVKEVPTLIDPKKKEKVGFLQVYDVTIPAQLGMMLREMGVKGLKPTEKSGQVKTDQKTLDLIIETAAKQFPFMGKIQRFRQIKTALANNLFPVLLDTTQERSPDGCVRVNFNGHKVDTGRFATPKPRLKEYFGQVRWNLHSIPAGYQKDRPECMLRIRECIQARPGKILFAIDYAGVELRIVTNISGEPKWLEEFFRCSGCNHKFERSKEKPPPPFCPKCGSDKIGDLHSLTAFAVYGEGIKGTPEFKGKRQKAKSLNFAMCYGGGPAAAQRAVDVDRDEGWRIKRQFDGSYTGLTAWWQRQQNFARKYKFVTTAFGRRYPLPDIDHEMGGFRSKAERNAVNGPIQGTSADITKLAMALVFRLCKKRGWLRRVLMTITIHDELVFEIDEAIAEEASTLIVEEMTRNKALMRLPHQVPYKCDVEFGDDWTVPHNLTEMAHNAENKKTRHLPGGGVWNERHARVFPKAYASFLAHGGVALDGVAAPDLSDDSATEGEGNSETPATDKPTVIIAGGEVFHAPETGKGKVCVHVVHTSRLSYGLMNTLAEVIHKVEGRGLETLRVETEDGIILYEDTGRLISAVEFKVLAGEYRV
jgi:DNA polymerase I-like protein with 3'-5' exonuclease and polymerase domains